MRKLIVLVVLCVLFLGVFAQEAAVAQQAAATEAAAPVQAAAPAAETAAVQSAEVQEEDVLFDSSASLDYNHEETMSQVAQALSAGTFSANSQGLELPVQYVWSLIVRVV